MKARQIDLSSMAESDDSTENESKSMRLQVFLAHSGAASRRASENLIKEGRVTVNGRQVLTMGEKVSPGDTVLLDGKLLKLETQLHYLVLNKPENYPLQTYIRSLTLPIELLVDMDPEQMAEYLKVSGITFNASKIVVTMVPVLILYPFLQRYFVSGLVMGSVKE